MQPWTLYRFGGVAAGAVNGSACGSVVIVIVPLFVGAVGGQSRSGTRPLRRRGRVVRYVGSDTLAAMVRISSGEWSSSQSESASVTS